MTNNLHNCKPAIKAEGSGDTQDGQAAGIRPSTVKFNYNTGDARETRQHTSS